MDLTVGVARSSHSLSVPKRHRGHIDDLCWPGGGGLEGTCVPENDFLVVLNREGDV